VNKVADIPYDFSGAMGVPITFLDKYNPDQFEIIDALNRYALLDVQGTNETVRQNKSHTCYIKGKSTYFRIVIRNKDIPK
jgi:site-specific DNA-methyltransferase (adenine-specific)